MGVKGFSPVITHYFKLFGHSEIKDGRNFIKCTITSSRPRRNMILVSWGRFLGAKGFSPAITYYIKLFGQSEIKDGCQDGHPFHKMCHNSRSTCRI